MARRAELRRLVRDAVVPGAVAGLIGGVAFGAAMILRGVLPTVASLVRTDSPVVGFVVHMTIAATVGAGLGILLRGRWSAGDLFFWGVAYAAFFWFLGPLTLQPLILGRMPTWDLAAAQAAYPSLVGHLIWGGTTGLALVAIKAASRVGSPDAPSPHADGADGSVHRHAPDASRPAAIVARGVIAGLIGFGAVSIVPAGADRMVSPYGAIAPGTGAGVVGTAGDALGPLAIALLAAVLYALLHPRSATTAGAAVVRGAVFGFLVWIVGGLTVLPLLRGEGLAWTLDAARGAFTALPASILFGGAMALAYHGLHRLARVFFSDDAAPATPDAGAWGLRAVVRGAAAGLVGGFLFTLVMVQIGFLPTVARLVGSDSELVGLVVHLVIAEIVGATYGVLFRRQAFDPAAAVGWGVSYGFVWWVLGPLTLAPMILGAAPAWTVAAAATAFPGLIGHLAYGAGLGWAFHVLEARHSPWWITRSQAEAARMARRRAEAASAGPALWALLVLVAVALPLILGG